MNRLFSTTPRSSAALPAERSRHGTRATAHRADRQRLLGSLCLSALLALPGYALACEMHEKAAAPEGDTRSQQGSGTPGSAGHGNSPATAAQGSRGGIIRVSTQGAAAAQATNPLQELAAFGWKDSQGKDFDVGSLKGKPVVINFWATWCAPCVKEMPELSALSKELGDQAAFLGISLDKQDKVQRFVERTPVAYPLLIADFKGLSLARNWGNKQGQMPYTVVLNAQGQPHWQHAGIVDVDALRSMLKSSELR